MDVGDTRPVVLAVLPAAANDARIGSWPLAVDTLTLAGADSGTFVGPTTVAPSGRLNVTPTNLRDALGNLLPDGAQVAVTANDWYNRDGSFGNGSVGGSITGGVRTPSDAALRTFTIAGGQVTLTFNAPATANVTSVISVLPADGNGHRPSGATLSLRLSADGAVAHAVEPEPDGTPTPSDRLRLRLDNVTPPAATRSFVVWAPGLPPNARLEVGTASRSSELTVVIRQP